MRTRWRSLLIVAALAAGIGWPLLHWERCRRSPLPAFTLLFENGDGFANYQWALGILEQGPLNPRPYHPYNNWMRPVASQEQWLAWWGGDKVFQQSPLYAYLLAAALRAGLSLVSVHLIQSLFVSLLAALLGLATSFIFQSRAAGWAAGFLALFFAPFYAYSWVLVRDICAWLLTAAALGALPVWWGFFERREVWSGRWAFWSALSGVVLGLGLLVREPFLLAAAAAAGAGAFQGWSTRRWKPLLLVMGCSLATALPLVARNLLVGVPPWAISNRGPEAFICSHAPSADPARAQSPQELGELMEKSGGSLPRAIYWTLAAHAAPGRAFFRLQLRKLQALFDPYETADNLNYYYIARWSPAVRYGLPFWFVLIPGLGGLALGILRRDRRQLWLWILSGAQLATLLFSGINGRYRAYFALFLIPWAAWFFRWLWARWREPGGRARAAGVSALLLAGWLLCLGPLAATPKSERWRATEQVLEAVVISKSGREPEARALLREVEARTGRAPGNLDDLLRSDPGVTAAP